MNLRSFDEGGIARSTPDRRQTNPKPKQALEVERRKKTDRRRKSPDANQILGIYQRIWKSRENTELVFRGISEEVDPNVESKIITFEQLIHFMRQRGYIIPLNEDATRFVRTEKTMPKARSHRDIKSFLEGKDSISRRQKRNRRRRAGAKFKRNRRGVT